MLLRDNGRRRPMRCAPAADSCQADVEGPYFYAHIPERAAIKKHDCPHCGDFDILVSPMYTRQHPGEMPESPRVTMASYAAVL